MPTRYGGFSGQHEKKFKMSFSPLQSHSSTGLVLILTWNPLHNGYGERVARYGCDFAREPGKVRIKKYKSFKHDNISHH